MDVFSRGAAGVGALANPDEAGFEPAWGTGEVWAALAAVLAVVGAAAALAVVDGATCAGFAAWAGFADCAFAGVFSGVVVCAAAATVAVGLEVLGATSAPSPFVAGAVGVAVALAEVFATGDVEAGAAVSGLCFCVPGRLSVTDCTWACELALGASACVALGDAVVRPAGGVEPDCRDWDCATRASNTPDVEVFPVSASVGVV